ncbi:MAG: hypothetical protein LBU65_14385 [Planctomycetaceae bacterium]|nr:hypothetical protein [Planctomycetaceae bacterium]
MFTYIKTFISRHSDWNPISLRELRQVTNSGILAWTICISVLVLSFYSLILVVDFADNFSRSAFNTNENEWFFFTILGITAGGTALVTLLNTLIRSIFDRVREDPMFYSMITPLQIVRGRIISTVITSFVMYSVALPYFVLAYNLRGVDFMNIIISFVITFVWIQIVNLVTTAFFVGVKGIIDAVTYLIPWGICVFFAVLMTICSLVLATVFNDDHIARMIFFMMVAIFGVLLTWLAYSLAVASLIPETCNRMFRTRFGITIILLAMAGFMLYYFPMSVIAIALGSRRDETAIVSFIIYNLTGVILFSFLSLIAVCERHDYPLRQRREVPRSILLRLLYFPFSSGVPNAFVWIGVMMLVWHGSIYCSMNYLYLLGYLGTSTTMSMMNDTHIETYRLVFRQLLTPLLYIYGYSIVTFWLYKSFLWRYWKQKHLWIMVFIVIVVVSLISFSAEFYFNGNAIRTHYHSYNDYSNNYQQTVLMGESQPLLAPNPLTLITEQFNYPTGYRVIQFIFAGGMSLLGFATMMVWAVKIFVRRFYHAE